METPAPSKEMRVVLIDIDHTILETTDIRLAAVRETIAQLSRAANLPFEQGEMIDIYTFLVDSWQLFEALGFGNFRRSWNLEAMYFALLGCAQAKRHAQEELAQFQRSVRELIARIQSMEQTIEDTDSLVKVSAKITGECLDFIALQRDYIDRLLDFIDQQEYSPFTNRAVKDAKQSFDRQIMHGIPLINGTIELITTAMTSARAKVYIVSEGDKANQWEKLERTGLLELIGDRVFITDEIANTLAYRLLLSHYSTEKERSGLLAQEIVHQIQAEHNRPISPLEDVEFQHMLKRYTALESELRSSKQSIDRLYALQFKWNPDMYKRVMHAINRSPEEPLQAIRRFEPVAPEDWKPLRVIMIGDRYDTDVMPLYQALGYEFVFTIRVLAGKYLERYSKAYLDERQLPSPKATVRSLFEAQALVADEGTWQQIEPLISPPHFD